MYSNIFLCFAFVYGLVCQVNSHALSSINYCAFGDDECMKASAIEALSKIAGGDPEIGIPSLDPLNIKLIENNSNGLKFKFSDVKVTGLKNCDIDKFSIEKEKVEAKIQCKLVIEGNYEVDGQLLILPIQGKGPFTLIMKKLDVKIIGELIKKKRDDGKLYYKIGSFKQESEAVEPIVFRLENLYNGNEALSKATHDFANKNYKEIYDAIGKPLLEDVCKDLMKIVNKIYTILPIDEAFLN